MLKAYAQWITRNAVLVLLVAAGASVFAASRLVDFATFAPRLVLDSSIEQMLPSDDPDVQFYARMRKVFGNDEALLLAVHRPEGVLEPGLLAALGRLTRRIEGIEGVERVISLANAPNVRTVDGDLQVGTLFETPPTSPAELERLRRDLFDNPLFVGSLISQDARTTGVVIALRDMPEQEFTDRRIDLRVQELAQEELGPGVGIWLVGSAHIKAETTRYLLRDLSLVLPLAFLLIAVVAALSFRSLRGVAIPITTLSLAELWTLGAMVGIDPKLNLVTVSVPSLLLVIGFAYSVHVMACYYDAIEDGRTWDANAATRGLASVLMPTFLTGGSTVAGFLSLVTNPLAAIRQFGLYGGIGVGFAALAAITVAPALLALLREPPRKGRLQEHGHSAFDRALARIGDFDCRHATGIFVAVALLCVLAVAGIPRIQINSTMVTNFPEQSPVRLAVEAVNAHHGGAGQLNIVLESDAPRAFEEPANLAVVEELQRWLATQPSITSSTSIADYVKLIHRGFSDEGAQGYRIPGSRSLVSQLLFFGASDETEHFVDKKRQMANVLVRTTAIDSGDLSALVRRIETRLAELPRHLQARVTGNIVLIAHTNDEIAVGQALSVGSAFVSIFLIMAALFMSVRIGIIAMIPNVFPVLLYFGVLGWTGITLNVATGLVASIVLGVAVDDTVHFLSRFNIDARRTASEREGVREALIHVGRPVTYSGIALIAGFLVLSLSSLRQQAEFGLLAAITLACAWLTDLIFTPAIASRIRVVTLWDVLTVDLGEDPQRAIPVFHGLSKWQARIVALMTEIVRAPKGQRLIQSGQESNGMYLVIEGELKSSVQADGHTVLLNAHGRGDVIGEVGLFRGQRTADVDCQSDVRLLRFDQANLARLQRRYPRTAARFFRNLSEVLAQRLAMATARLR